MTAPFLQAVRDREGEHPTRVYPLSNPPDEADFVITRKLYARHYNIPLERAVLVSAETTHHDHDKPDHPRPDQPEPDQPAPENDP